MNQYYTHASQGLANATANAIFALHRAKAVLNGYTIQGGEIIGKKNGVSAPDSQRTNAWSSVKEDVQGRFLVDYPADPDLRNGISASVIIVDPGDINPSASAIRILKGEYVDHNI